VAPSLSADGTKVAFLSRSRFGTGKANNTYEDVFLKDLTNGAITLVSRNGVTPSNFHSYDPAISGDGTKVAYASRASNLVASDTNGRQDIFVYNVATGFNTNITPTGNGQCYWPSLSYDGSLVAYNSAANNLVAGDTNARQDIFLWNGSTTRIGAGNGHAGQVAVSENGQKVAFASFATDVAGGDSNGKSDIFVYDFGADSLTRASLPAGAETNPGDSDQPGFSWGSADRYLTFRTQSNDFPPQLGFADKIVRRESNTALSFVMSLPARTFSYNPQDRAIAPPQVVGLDAHFENGHPRTNSVILENWDGIFDAFGNLEFLSYDPGHILPENASGNYDYPLGDASYTTSAAYSTVAITVDRFNEELDRIFGANIFWAFPYSHLGVSPETGGPHANAFYYRTLGGVFFFDIGTTSTGDSGEVASHEAGHAILDAMRPGYLSGVGTETGAFHESFGDMLAMVMCLSNDPAIATVVAETGGTGNLSSGRNSLANMGEDFGNAVGYVGGIRTAYNQFVYQDPSTLPFIGNETQLGAEIHDFSRLFTGAFYDILDGISDANRASAMSPAQALKATGQEAWTLLVGQCLVAPVTSDITYSQMAYALIDADIYFNAGRRTALITQVMVSRGIIPPGVNIIGRTPPSPTYNSDGVTLEVTLGPAAGALSGVTVETIVPPSQQTGFVAPTTSRVEKSVQHLLAHDLILFTTNETPSLGEIFKPDGSAYTAYVTTDDSGQRVLRRIPLVSERRQQPGSSSQARAIFGAVGVVSGFWSEAP
jgi:hypothetical protein